MLFCFKNKQKQNNLKTLRESGDKGEDCSTASLPLNLSLGGLAQTEKRVWTGRAGTPVLQGRNGEGQQDLPNSSACHGLQEGRDAFRGAEWFPKRKAPSSSYFRVLPGLARATGHFTQTTQAHLGVWSWQG